MHVCVLCVHHPAGVWDQRRQAQEPGQLAQEGGHQLHPAVRPLTGGTQVVVLVLVLLHRQVLRCADQSLTPDLCAARHTCPAKKYGTLVHHIPTPHGFVVCHLTCTGPGQAGLPEGQQDQPLPHCCGEGRQGAGRAVWHHAQEQREGCS